MTDYVNPDHYKLPEGKQVWEVMIEKFGEEAFLNFCDLNVFKYRARSGKKPSEDAAYDEAKAMWYEEKAQLLRLQLALKEGENNYESEKGELICLLQAIIDNTPSDATEKEIGYTACAEHILKFLKVGGAMLKPTYLEQLENLRKKLDEGEGSGIIEHPAEDFFAEMQNRFIHRSIIHRQYGGQEEV